MKNKISIGVILASVIVSFLLLVVFIPHYQNSVKYSGGVLELEFEDGTKQYVANGGTINVAMGSNCTVRVNTPTSSDNYEIRLKNGEISEDGTVVFDSRQLYVFDLYLTSGIGVAMFLVEVV